jgi:hypothetical protein
MRRIPPTDPIIRACVDGATYAPDAGMCMYSRPVITQPLFDSDNPSDKNSVERVKT